VPPAPPQLRASDADRDKVADLLREALAEGRLTPEEHAERIDAVYAARTYAELAPITEDLPAARDMQLEASVPGLRPHDPGLPAPHPAPGSVTAVFSAAERKGRWLVEPHTNVQAIFGGAMLDFRQAVLTQREVTLNIVAVFGGVEIKVPPGVRVIGDGAAVFGGWDLPGDETVEAGAPVIRLTGLALFGGVEVKRDILPKP
jgi:hypothetical protein